MSNILWFEKTGNKIPLNDQCDIPCRSIKSVFLNNNSHAIYVAIAPATIYRYKTIKTNVPLKRPALLTNFALNLGFAYNITLSTKREINHIAYDNEIIKTTRHYTKADVVKTINEVCDANFDGIDLFDEFDNYRVFNSPNNTLDANVMDCYNHYSEKAVAMRKAFEELKITASQKRPGKTVTVIFKRITATGFQAYIQTDWNQYVENVHVF